MPADASIYGGIQQARPINRLAELAQAMQVQGLQQQGELGRLQMDKARRDIEQDNALSAAYAGALGADGKLDRGNLLARMASGGLGAKIPGIQKGFADQDKAATDADQAKFKLATERYDYFKKTLGALSQEPSLTKDMVLQSGQALVEQGILPPQMYQSAIASMPDDPQQLRARLTQGLKAQMSPEQIFTVFSPKVEKIDTGAQILTRDMNPNSQTFGQNVGGAPVAKEQSPESIASNATTRRGQDMTDKRARDFNTIQQDANDIKRAEKKEVQDLTKNSQIASFDTMLGTLDRLENHAGLSRSVGAMGALPTMPGSDSANFQAELNTFQSQAFLPMVAQLKGMGALSDSEGKKLTAAVGALDPKMGEVAFRESVKRIKEDMEAARERLSGSRRDGNKGKPAEPVKLTAANADAEYAKLPSGAEFIAPDGSRRRKP